MLLPGRHGNSSDYRYGFNGKESDNEVKGEGAQYDYGFRIYDPRLGKFLSQDPLMNEYPFYTPYQFAGNSPIIAIDLDGLEMKFSNTEISCVQTSNKKSNISIISDVSIHFKILNTTGVKLEGAEKVTYEARKQIQNSYSDKTGLFNLSLATDFEGNQTDVTNYDVRGTVNRFSSSYEVISSLDKINDNDYVIILTDKPLKGGQTKTSRIPPAYTYLNSNVMVLNISDSKYNAQKDKFKGNYDFNGGGNLVRALGNTIAHEFGHGLGLEDKYDELDNKYTKPKQGYAKNRMGDSGYSFINGSQVNTIMQTIFEFMAIEAYRKTQLGDETYTKDPDGKTSKERTENILLENRIKSDN